MQTMAANGELYTRPVSVLSSTLSALSQWASWALHSFSLDKELVIISYNLPVFCLVLLDFYIFEEPAQQQN